MENIKINIARDFSKNTGIRFKKEGAFSGEKFREDLLIPKYVEALEKNVKLEINLDETEGFAASFLEESFGGLGRLHDPEECLKIIEFISEENPSYIQEVKDDINQKNVKKR